MPMYSFGCESCNIQWDEVRAVSDRDVQAGCRKCGGPAERGFDSPNFHDFPVHAEYVDENLTEYGSGKPFVVKSHAQRAQRQKELGLADAPKSDRTKDIQRNAQRNPLYFT